MLTKDDFNEILNGVRTKPLKSKESKEQLMTNGTSERVQAFLATLSDDEIKNKLADTLCQDIERDID